ncbi:MAG: response regulator transcription factor [Actinomycetota bacterium]
MRILVVEDSVKMAALLRKGLEREGYAVDVAGSGQDAVWMAEENECDVIVLDIILESGESPLDGVAVCRKIRTADCRTPVLMVTARDTVEDRVRGLDIGADDYLAKPFSLPELLARVRALIRRGAVERPVMLRVGDLSLNQGRHEVERGGLPGSRASHWANTSSWSPGSKAGLEEQWNASVAITSCGARRQRAIQRSDAPRRLAGCPVAAPAGGADLGVGDLVVKQGVQLGGLGAGVAEAAADGFDGDAGVETGRERCSGRAA